MPHLTDEEELDHEYEKLESLLAKERGRLWRTVLLHGVEAMGLSALGVFLLREKMEIQSWTQVASILVVACAVAVASWLEQNWKFRKGYRQALALIRRQRNRRGEH